MNPAEAAELLSLAAAFDRRTIGEADARAWAAALHKIPLDDDARATVAAYYATSPRPGERAWMQPHHVRTLRAGIRADRIEAAHPVYDGDPDETGVQFTERRRAQLMAAASGHIPAQTITRAIGAPAPREIRSHLAGIGRTVEDSSEAGRIPADARRRIRATLPGRRTRLPELAVACPVAHCRAHPRGYCVTPAQREMRTATHGSRRDAWATATTTCPECDTATGEPCPAADPHPARIRAALTAHQTTHEQEEVERE